VLTAGDRDWQETLQVEKDQLVPKPMEVDSLIHKIEARLERVVEVAFGAMAS
jgi:hypothetical protein